jgi:8-hydroxy-5-deazaflavin:NADPH oxidoreductase
MAALGLIGSGNIGGTLARLAVDAGLDVVLSNSRAPQTLYGLVDELGPQARAATPAQAAAAGDWVVVTIPLGAIGTVPREPLAGKTVIDTGTPVFCAPYAVTKDDQYGSQPAAPGPAAEIRAALASARR